MPQEKEFTAKSTSKVNSGTTIIHSLKWLQRFRYVRVSWRACKFSKCQNSRRFAYSVKCTGFQICYPRLAFTLYIQNNGDDKNIGSCIWTTSLLAVCCKEVRSQNVDINIVENRHFSIENVYDKLTANTKLASKNWFSLWSTWSRSALVVHQPEGTKRNAVQWSDVSIIRTLQKN